MVFTDWVQVKKCTIKEVKAVFFLLWIWKHSFILILISRYIQVGMHFLKKNMDMLPRYEFLQNLIAIQY